MWLLSAGHFRQWPRIVIPASDEMSERSEALHKEHQWIERAEPHGAGHMLDRHLRIAMTGSQAPTGAPSDCKVRIEHECAIDQRSTRFGIASSVEKRDSTERERDRIVLA